MRSERLLKSSGEFVTAFGKVTGLAGRLALVFHVLESPFSPMVSADVMTRVVRIIREFIVPTYRYVFDSQGSMSAYDAWVIEYIIQYSDKPSITLSDIKRGARRQFEKAGVKQNLTQNEWTLGAMYLLEKMGWVARIDDGSKEYQSVAEWLINPHLKTTFREYREAVVRAKMERDKDRLEKAGITHYEAKAVTHGAEILECV
jgi:hypothetical protein